jgi:drug/metabolite transporter (DMT)-like permease
VSSPTTVTPASQQTAAPAHGRLVALAVLVTVLWSSSWVLIRTGLDDAALPPLTFAGLRYALAALALSAWLRLRQNPVLRRSHGGSGRPDLQRTVGWRRLVLLGLVQFAVTQGAQFVAIDHQPAATTSLLLATTPLVVAVTAGVIGEPPTVRHVVAGLGIAAGAAIYFAGELGWTGLGLTAALVGLAGNTAAVLLGRSTMQTPGLDVGRLTRTTMAIGAGALVAVGVALDGWPRLTLTGGVIVAWLAIVNTAAAFTWWNVCLRHLPASEVAAINSTMVIQIPLLAWIFLDEPLGWAEGFGLAVVAVGVVAASRPRRGASETGKKKQ